MTWEYSPTASQDPGEIAAMIRRTLDEFCQDWGQYYADPGVDGWELGRIQFGVTVTSRDQWWVGRRAKRVLSAIRAFTDVDIDLVKQVSVDRLPPHDHRSAAWLEEHRSPSTT